MKKSEKYQESIMTISQKIQKNSYIKAISEGFMSALPITMIGGMASLINMIGIQSYQDFLVNTGLKSITSIPTQVTTNILALYIVFLITQKFVNAQGYDGNSAGLLSLFSFFVLTPFNLDESGSYNSIPMQWLGAQGLFSAILIAILVSHIYILFNEKGWTIKMPEMVPPVVSKSFSSLLPAFAIAFVSLILNLLISLTPFNSAHELIYNYIGLPLTSLGGSFPAMLLGLIISQVLWVFGVHGTIVVWSAFTPVWSPLTTANLSAYNAGLEIPHIVSDMLFAQAFVMGAGATLGLSLVMLLHSKSKRYKELGKLSIVPNLFGINEPITFGVPIVMNFTLAIPFILIPSIILILAYLLMKIELLPLLPGMGANQVPVGISAILSGGGWRWVVFQLATVAISYFGYKPFFNIVDKVEYEIESGVAE